MTRAMLVLLPLIALALMLMACGEKCEITAEVTPTRATADHALASPGNQVQFAARSKDDCRLRRPTIIKAGMWSTSDPANTSISTTEIQTDQGVAHSFDAVVTCLNRAPAPVLISYSGLVDNVVQYTPAMLTCK